MLSVQLPNSAKNAPASSLFGRSTTLALGFLLFPFLIRKRRALAGKMMAAIAALVLVGALAGCASAGMGIPGTQMQDYKLTVKATSGMQSVSTNLSLIVQ